MKLFLIGIKDGIHAFGEAISLVVNTILLFVAYVVGIGFVAIIAKIKKKHFLRMEIEQTQSSYWEDIEQNNLSLKSCYRQS
ncbi:hypothetical protein CL622_08315 [archaeon]|nr:hypothetical protein [archaeon]